MPVRRVGGQQIVVLGAALVRHEAAAALLPAALPVTGVAGKDRQLPAGIDEALDLGALVPAPVFGVADDDHGAIAVKRARLDVEIGIGEVVECVARAFGPGNEGVLPFVEEAGRAVPAIAA